MTRPCPARPWGPKQLLRITSRRRMKTTCQTCKRRRKLFWTRPTRVLRTCTRSLWRYQLSPTRQRHPINLAVYRLTKNIFMVIRTVQSRCCCRSAPHTIKANWMTFVRRHRLNLRMINEKQAVKSVNDYKHRWSETGVKGTWEPCVITTSGD